MSAQFNRRGTILEKLMNNMEQNEMGCWCWTGGTSGNGRGGGYGRVWLDGQTVAVHIVSYTHFKGYIPGKLQVDHICGNRRCFNPDHLELVTQEENCRRRDEAKRKRDQAKRDDLHKVLGMGNGPKT